MPGGEAAGRVVRFAMSCADQRLQHPHPLHLQGWSHPQTGAHLHPPAASGRHLHASLLQLEHLQLGFAFFDIGAISSLSEHQAHPC